MVIEVNDDRDRAEVPTTGNAAGWTGVRLQPSETDRREATLKDGREGYDHTHLVRGLRPYETVSVVVEWGDNRETLRVVATYAGVVRFDMGEAYTVRSDARGPDLTLSVQTSGGHVIVVGAEAVDDATDFEGDD